MPDLPTGTVTSLLTDLEGSTALWEQHPEAMRQALVRHDALVEQIVAEHHGHVVRPPGEGDSRFAVFSRATDAVTAAAARQQALYAEPWPTPSPLLVRMALHTGEADLREGDYYGSAVNRCARLRAVAHGGQTLISLATEHLVRGQRGARSLCAPTAKAAWRIPTLGSCPRPGSALPRAASRGPRPGVKPRPSGRWFKPSSSKSAIRSAPAWPFDLRAMTVDDTRRCYSSGRKG
jgi:class 3 adenylate cyclase